jgi:UDP-N-acetylglucosamine 2-epimerase
MKTSMQELIQSLKAEQMTASNEWQTGYQKALSNVIDEAESLLEKEKEQMVDFAFKYGDLTTREIADSFDKEYKTNEK